MAIYNQGKLAGIVGYKQLYPNKPMPALDVLLKGLSRIWAIRLVSNMQNKLVGKPFYNPDFNGEKTGQIDVPRFFFGSTNVAMMYNVIQRFEDYVKTELAIHQQPMLYAAGDETPLLLLKYIMAMPENENKEEITVLERNLYSAFMIANELTLNKDKGEPPYKAEDDLEMHIASLMLSRYAYNDFTNQETNLSDLFRNQNARTTQFFKFVSEHPKLKDLYDEFLKKYSLKSWNDYLLTYWGIMVLAKSKTGIIDFQQIKADEGLLSEQIVDKDSINIHKEIAFADNIDYQAFRDKPFIKISQHEYAVVDVSFMINRMFDGLYFMFNDLWKQKHPNNQQGFNRIYTTEFSEETILVNCLKEVAGLHGWFSLTDKECKAIIPEKKLSSPPDFYIRNGEDVIIFECKDVKIPKEIKAEGTIKQLLDEVDKDFVRYKDDKEKWRLKGVGQLVRNAKRIQDGLFAWDKDVDTDCRIFLVLVLADSKQVAAGWKNYLNRKMYEECLLQKVDYKRVCPLILMDLGTLVLYKENFKKYGFLHYFIDYFQKTTFNPRVIPCGDKVANIMNQTLSFSRYMNKEKILGGEEFGRNLLEEITKYRKRKA